MSPFENIAGAIHDLSYEEKVILRKLLDEDLQAAKVPAGHAAKPGHGIIGLFADEPELMDSVLEAMHERRSRPLRIDS
jgi:hypothetical protein